MTISTISLTITDALGGSPTASGSPKDKGTLKKWLKKLPDTLKRLAVEILPAIVGNAVGAILSLSLWLNLHGLWLLFLQDLWLMQNVKK